MRFQELVDKQQPLMAKRGSGLDNFGGDKCDLCHKTFDPSDARIWTRETGKAHYRCYAEWRKQP